MTILVILFRRRICCYDKDGDKVSGTSTDSSALANNVILKVRLIQELGTVKLLTYSHLSNKRGGWNKRGGVAKFAKSLNVEVGINVELGIF